MDGIELAARFSFITNHLRFCGPESAENQFLHYLKKKDNSEEVEFALKRFEGLYPYLSAIAKKANGSFADYQVVEGYWIGNSLLDNFKDADIKDIIKKLMNRGLPKSLGNRLIEKLPAGLVPHHNFNVFYVGVGNITGSVEATIQNMDNCRISQGTIQDVIGDHLVVKTDSIVKEKGIYGFKDDVKNVVYHPEFLPVKKGDIVALHWGYAAMKLTKEQSVNLEKYTIKILDVINSQSRAS